MLALRGGFLSVREKIADLYKNYLLCFMSWGCTVVLLRSYATSCLFGQYKVTKTLASVERG